MRGIGNGTGRAGLGRSGQGLEHAGHLPWSTCPPCTPLCAAVYWITGLYRSAGNFFIWLVVIWSVSNCERWWCGASAGLTE